MKILHLAVSYFPYYGGTSVRLYSLLSSMPYESILVTSNELSDGNVTELKVESFGNIKVKRAPLAVEGIYTKSPLRYVKKIFQNPRILFNSARFDEFDVVHAHEMPIFFQAAKKLSIKLNKPLVIEFHAIRKDYYGSYITVPKFKKTVPKIKGILNTFHGERIIKDVLKHCDHVITLTHLQKRWISNHYKIKQDLITVVPNGVDINKFTPRYRKKSEEVKEKFSLSNTIVMYSGALDRVNGITDFVNIIPSILNKKPDISFLFIGHGNEKLIIALSKKYPQVKLLPTVHYDEMPIYYQMCDLFVIPRPSTISAETLTPLKLLEVMAMGKPVLGSDVGGIAEVIKHGENGYLFEKGNMESFKKTLLEVLDVDNTKIGKNARKTIVDNYTWDKPAKILQKVYEDLV